MRPSLLQLTRGASGVAMVHFGPKLNVGDTITVEVDTVQKAARVYRNQAR